MNCNEVLSDLERSDSVTVRTIMSPSNEQRSLITGEKEYRRINMPFYHNDNMKSRQSDEVDQNKNTVRDVFGDRRANFGGFRRDNSSLKRNLFNEFNSISNIDENAKKDTVEEIFSPSQLAQESKQDFEKKEVKAGPLAFISPVKIAPPKYIACLDTPSVHNEFCGRKRLSYESIYSSP